MNAGAVSRRLLSCLLDYASPSKRKLRQLHRCGQLAIIPVGFRCDTKPRIRKFLGISQGESLPFDYGFFPPSAVASVLIEGRIELSGEHSDSLHAVCMKEEGYKHPSFGQGIKFTRSSYKEINSLALSPDMQGIRKYLDHEFGYYTLDLTHHFVLAHYNWHPFASRKHPERVCNPAQNLRGITALLNRRLARMRSLCSAANNVLFVFAETQGYGYMLVDDMRFPLDDLEQLEAAGRKLFPEANVIAVHLGSTNSARRALAVLRERQVTR